jgi:tetratricopeptide (TPR) repeat protein
MIAMTTTTVLLALTLLADPAKESWEAVNPAMARASFMPRSALIEVDGQPRGRGSVELEVTDPKRTFRVRLSAEGFEPAEAVVEAGKIAHRQFHIALRPAGFDRPVDTTDAPSLALAAAALWRAGRADDAADYAEQSLRNGNTALANKVLGEVWRMRGNRDQAVRFFTMYLSLAPNSSDAPEIKSWLMQDRPGDITIPADGK